MANLYCVYLAVGGIAWLVSAGSDRRGRAIAVIFALLLISFLLNFLAQFWAPARQIAFLSVMHYYQPARILSSGHFPYRDVLILSVSRAASWMLGCEVFARRNIARCKGALARFTSTCGAARPFLFPRQARWRGRRTSSNRETGQTS